jgi:hypothetical protein
VRPTRRQAGAVDDVYCASSAGCESQRVGRLTRFLASRTFHELVGLPAALDAARLSVLDLIALSSPEISARVGSLGDERAKRFVELRERNFEYLTSNDNGTQLLERLGYPWTVPTEVANISIAQIASGAAEALLIDKLRGDHRRTVTQSAIEQSNLLAGHPFSWAEVVGAWWTERRDDIQLCARAMLQHKGEGQLDTPSQQP